jgi:PBSX family phage portal protein
MTFDEVVTDERRKGQGLVATAKAASSTHAARASVGGGDENALAAAHELEPPYQLLKLCWLHEQSNALRPNVDAYCTNIDGFGHRLEAALDLTTSDADARVAECMLLERMASSGLDPEAVPEPSAAEVQERREAIVRMARIERARLEAFFGHCAMGQSFVRLRRSMRQDLEVTGNAYWEVLRAANGSIARLVAVSAHSMRLLPLDAEPTEFEEPLRISPISLGRMTTIRRLRRYVQVLDARRVHFKELGDPRVISRDTGAVFESIEALKSLRPTDAPATEVLHFTIPSTCSPYGVPRWIGNLLSVLGSREMEEVNHSYFQNKSVPPLALLVSGGKLAEGMAGRVERFIEENIKGKANFHRILIVEAESQGATANGDARARLELKPLTEAQQQDALFSEYDERNIDKVGSAFRLPRLLRGDSRDLNRSTAEAALRFAEDQVFAPEREDFDYVINDRLLAAMGIRFWRFRSQTPFTRDPERMTAMVEKLVRVGVLTPEEGRVLAGDIFNREFVRLNADWTHRPITLTLAGIQNAHVGAPREPRDMPGSAFEQPARVSAPDAEEVREVDKEGAPSSDSSREAV